MQRTKPESEIIFMSGSTPDGGQDSMQVGAEQTRRIPIGTQRAGVKPPKLPPRYQYTPHTAAGSSTEAESAPAALSDPVVGFSMPANLSLPTSTSLPTGATPANATPKSATQAGMTRPSDNEGGGSRDRDRKRDKRGAGSKSSFMDVLPQQKRVAIPNLREALEDDLESDFQAALAGVSMDDLLSSNATAHSEAPLEPGARVTGIVLSIGSDTAFVDLGGRRQGAMKLAGLIADEAEMPVVGQSLELSVGSRSEEDGLYDVAFANRAVKVENWSQLQAGMIVEARVTGANKGGIECEVAGLSGFMPASLISPWRIENFAEMVGQTLECLVTDVVPEARRLVLSRRAVIERQTAEARTKMLETLEVGATLEGIVRSVRDFGAFVDIGGGVEGLVHVSQLSWDRVDNPADILTPGQKVSVVVKKIDRETGKIALSARDLIESPWKHAAEKYHLGSTVRGTVSRIAQFGAFVKLEPGIEGLVHVSEIASRHVRSVGDVVKEGEVIECRVLAVDPDEQRMSLSIKALASTAVTPEDDQEASDAQATHARERRSQPLKGGLGGLGNFGGHRGLGGLGGNRYE